MPQILVALESIKFSLEERSIGSIDIRLIFLWIFLGFNRMQAILYGLNSYMSMNTWGRASRGDQREREKEM